MKNLPARLEPGTRPPRGPSLLENPPGFPRRAGPRGDHVANPIHHGRYFNGLLNAYAIASTMVRRWALLRDADPRSPFRSRTDLVVGRVVGPTPTTARAEVALRGYSQPVPVRWRTAERARVADRAVPVADAS